MINVVSLKEKITIAGFPFCRVLCEIPVTVPPSRTDSSVFNKHLRKPDFSDLAINK